MEATRRLIDGILTDAIATGKSLDPAAVFVGLSTGTAPGSPPATVAALELPDATDMPAVALGTWGPIRYLSDGHSVVEAPAKVFALPSSTHSFSATGVYLADAATGGNVLMFIGFVTPVPMPDQHSAITVIVRIGLDINGSYNATAIVTDMVA